MNKSCLAKELTVSDNSTKWALKQMLSPDAEGRSQMQWRPAESLGLDGREVSWFMHFPKVDLFICLQSYLHVMDTDLKRWFPGLALHAHWMHNVRDSEMYCIDKQSQRSGVLSAEKAFLFLLKIVESHLRFLFWNNKCETTKPPSSDFDLWRQRLDAARLLICNCTRTMIRQTDCRCLYERRIAFPLMSESVALISVKK